MFRICDGRLRLAGIEAPPAYRNIELLPYGITSLKTVRVSGPAGLERCRSRIGGSISTSALRQCVTAEFTYNTDFAQVEVDELAGQPDAISPVLP